MMKPKILSLAVAGACALLGTTAANAGIGFKAGEWDIDFSGNVNAFYTYASCDDTAAVIAGGLACGGGDDPVSVRSGLLPSAFVISAKTRQGAFDVGVTFGLYPGINSQGGASGSNLSGGQPNALATSNLDFRQNFLTIGGDRWGTLKLGRDIGIFGSDAILSDMTLLGVGSTGGNAAPTNTSLGRIGLGYIYTDFQPQITYTTPKFGGFQVSGGVFTPLQTLGLSAAGAGVPAAYTANESPGYQAKATFEFGAAAGSPGLGGKAWFGGLYQENELAGGTVAPGVADEVTGWAVDGGAKLNFAIVELVGYIYKGSGVGTTGLFLFGADAGGDERDSNGYYGQAAVKFGPAKVGYSYGRSNLSLGGNEGGPAGNAALVKSNESHVVGLYYALTKSVNLVGEYIRTTSENHAQQEIEEDAFAIGAILFF